MIFIGYTFHDYMVSELWYIAEFIRLLRYRFREGLPLG